MESITLPSRLKLSHGSRETYNLLSNSLNINGNQTIAKLQMSIDQSAATNGDSKGKESNTEATDTRMSAYNLNEDTYEKDASEFKPLDLDFFPPDAGDQYHRSRGPKKNHIFGQTEIIRTSADTNTTSAHSIDVGHERARRRAAGLTISQRYVPPLSMSPLHYPSPLQRPATNHR
jgi:hypothetical protein